MDAAMQRFASTFSSDAQVKLLAIKAKYSIDQNDIEAFELNSGGKLTEAKLSEFEKNLEEEAASKLKKAQSKKQQQDLANSKKRKFEASFGMQRSKPLTATKYDVTPERKRPYGVPVPVPDARTELPTTDAPGALTPDPPPRHAEVVLKTSINEKLAGPPPDGATAAPEISILGDNSWHKSKDQSLPYSWMDDSVESRSNAADARLQRFEKLVVESLCQKYGEDVQEGQLGANSQAEVVVCGRILPEFEGKPNEQSLLLEGSRESCRGKSVRLVTSECPDVVAFPGQIVGVVGRSSPSGHQFGNFHARYFASGLPLNLKEPSKTASPLHVMTAAGPFSLRDDLNFAPIETVFQRAMDTRPQALFLLGPLLDSNNLRVQEGDCRAPGSNHSRTLQEVYMNQIVPLLTRLCIELRQSSPHTKVMLVPSLDEALIFHPLPQPPMDLTMCLEGNPLAVLQRQGVGFLSNPCMVKVNDVSIAVSSADALSPVLRDLVFRSNGKRIEEALRQLLLQRTLFPVFPRSHPVSEAHADALNFPDDAMPDICLFPSAVAAGSGTFVDDCLFLNPGPLCRATLGTFAEVVVHQGESALPDRVRVDIQKLC
eukprot:gnl/MRDRNA2_/MRDRNA2_92675_c0_seq1.p1 gnl/MRDRNA2_/MRDRNA2_92675_c0~~gnl/MRDRNA2_/MRDRNA2_92675_c0_seq1.p1  ORF type:complete len:630 (+),score=114.79 gnl/MRDRNA2_/MRDRNA2_92675_c0_seq1:94-1890(+)